MRAKWRLSANFPYHHPNRSCGNLLASSIFTDGLYPMAQLSSSLSTSSCPTLHIKISRGLMQLHQHSQQSRMPWQMPHPKPGAPTCIMMDASDAAVGAVLQQYIKGQWLTLAYFSRTLKPAQVRYSTFNRELLGIYLAIKHFRYFVEARHFHVLTDQKPLTFTLAHKPDCYSPRQSRQLEFISQFTSDIHHVKETGNAAADAMSRLPINAVHTGDSTSVVDFRSMAAAQLEDSDITRLQTVSSLKLQQVPLALSDGDTILCDVCTGVPRPFVPANYRRLEFDVLHSLAHPGIRATQRLVTQRFVWPGINMDIRRWARSCLQCQRAKVHRHAHSPPGTFTTPDARFDQVHIDLVGPLPPSDGCSYVFTCVDRFTR